MSEQMEQQFDNLARATRAWFSEQRPRERAPAWLVLERAMRRRQRAASRARLGGGLVLGVAVVMAVFWLRGVLRPEVPLTYRLSGAPIVSVEQQVENVEKDAIRASEGQAWLSFSDGSDVVLQPGARGRVVATTVHGARVRLDVGSARFSIRHRPQAEWSVVAGPFIVVVHGTVFDVAWSAESEALQVGLVTGAVTVRGPVAGGAVAVRPGQRLTAHASTGQTRIDRLADAAAPLEAPVVEPAPPTVKSPALEAAPLPADAPAAGPSHPRKSAAAAVREVSASWAARVASGAFRGVVADAQMLGVERCLSLAPAASLASLADAARFARHPQLARRALLAERRRFAGTVGAHDAAFLIGRLADDASGEPGEALRWYDRYLVEAGSTHAPTYAAEALGRRMLALERLGRGAEARAAAAAYLRDFPEGPHAKRAQHLEARR